MPYEKFKTNVDRHLATLVRTLAPRWEMSISELIAFCVREKLQIDPFTDAEMLPPDHPLNARTPDVTPDVTTTVVEQD